MRRIYNSDHEYKRNLVLNGEVSEDVYQWPYRKIGLGYQPSPIGAWTLISMSTQYGVVVCYFFLCNGERVKVPSKPWMPGSFMGGYRDE